MKLKYYFAAAVIAASALVSAVILGWVEGNAAFLEGVISRLGIEVKGLWLIDFDSGAGYYCWRHPETGLHFFHSYEDGFRGRMPIQ